MSPIWSLQFELMPECGYWIRDIFLSHLHRKWKNIDFNTSSWDVSIAIPLSPGPISFYHYNLPIQLTSSFFHL